MPSFIRTKVPTVDESQSNIADLLAKTFTALHSSLVDAVDELLPLLSDVVAAPPMKLLAT